MPRARLTTPFVRLRTFPPRSQISRYSSIIAQRASPLPLATTSGCSKRPRIGPNVPSVTPERRQIARMGGTAVEKEGLVIPLIDFSKFLHGTPDERKETAGEILHGFQNAGFIYLKNHPIPLDVVQHTFSMSANFFRQSDEAKMDVSEQMDIGDITKERDAAPDLKESYEIGREGEEKHPNQWPQREEGPMAGFKKDMLSFHDLCKGLHFQVMSAIAVGMGLDDGFFDKHLDVGDNTLRLLHYPAVDSSVFANNANAVRAGAHSDYGSITLLFQDARGGLQVRSPTGTFVDATPIEGTIVVNAGDLLARWSNDTIRSTIHRVVEPPFKQGPTHPARYSIAYFCNPNFSSFIEALPGTYATEGEKKYPGITSGDYLVQRLTATY
uniref:Fe2OG dioxygenase domain-containing protein n=1 Tax=Bionectria ochroleuca TaxID=29856 RepID=A0A8H7N4R1_BIOOC